MDRHADRPRLVGERPCDGLADPPGCVGRELEAPPPVELLDGADEPQGAFLDQVEERQALIPVVLRDRDDEAQVGLDHALLREHVAGLDLLRKLDLLRGGQQLVPPGLAEKELQRVGRRLDRSGGGRRWGGGLFLLPLGLLGEELDAPPVELHVHCFELEDVELERLEELLELSLANVAACFACFEQRRELLRRKDGFDLDCAQRLKLPLIGVPLANRVPASRVERNTPGL